MNLGNTSKMHELEIKPELDKKLIKLFKKDRTQYEAVINKINEILNSDTLEHYKHLRYDMKESQRVHIGHFILVFSYKKEIDLVSFEDYGHHDDIYNS